MRVFRNVLFAVLFIAFLPAFGQIQLAGTVINAVTKERLPFVNIYLENKHSGLSSEDATFNLLIPSASENDTLTFLIIGYNELKLSIRDIIAEDLKVFQLSEKPTQLKELHVSAERLKEKKFGLKRDPGFIQFYEGDGAHDPKDLFELAHLIRLGNSLSKITSINLFTGGSKSDTAIFRVHFYAFDGKRPKEELITENIVKVCFLKPGWLTINLSEYNIRLKSNVVAALEYIPSKYTSHPILYNIKLGGFSRTFSRGSNWLNKTDSLNEWQVPPGHYRMYVTALVNGNEKISKKEEQEEDETPATFRMYSGSVKDSFSVFVKLPSKYNKHKKYPVVYLLDGNVYFDLVSTSIKQLNAEKQAPESILVGIGYKDAFIADSLRERDYSFPEGLSTDSLRNSGGGNLFLDFIENQLVPYIDRTYSTDTSIRILAGHSLGGYFTLYALSRQLNEKHYLFNGFIAGSPSIGYHQQYLLQQFKGVNKSNKSLLRLYMTMGSLELREAGATEKYNSFSKAITNIDPKALNSKTELYPNRSHMETAIPSFENGLKYFYKK